MTSPGFARPSWRRASASIVDGSSFNRRFSSRSRAFSCLRAATRASSTCACCLARIVTRNPFSPTSASAANTTATNRSAAFNSRRRRGDGGTGAGFRRRSGSGVAFRPGAGTTGGRTTGDGIGLGESFVQYFSSRGCAEIRVTRPSGCEFSILRRHEPRVRRHPDDLACRRGCARPSARRSWRRSSRRA